ncbi:hypothetical protein HNR00_002705 [Methylorubrum rhodinum]|uniref:Uncharacterized protein n=1 Tax=Methylorubrum rhodinum TaxID=29428 RepID=A0A840ZLM4_9HYPH|nr:hypothetical protein [Methylorubrum rhodinum]MBB5757988.1 hypothetical protein [Methylorubrum rhodinum]
MPKRRDPSRTSKPRGGADEPPRPEQSAVERALERVLERLKPKPPRKGT